MRKMSKARDDRPGLAVQACFTVGHVWSIQVYVEVGSPFGQPGGAVMFRIGMVMIRAGSRMGNGYSGTFLLKPVIASLYPWWLSGRMYTYPPGPAIIIPSIWEMIASSSGQPPASLFAFSTAVLSTCVAVYAPSAWKFGYSLNFA